MPGKLEILNDLHALESRADTSLKGLCGSPYSFFYHGILLELPVGKYNVKCSLSLWPSFRVPVLACFTPANVAKAWKCSETGPGTQVPYF